MTKTGTIPGILDKKLQSGISKLSDKQKKAVYSVVKAFIDETDKQTAPWGDADFVAEMDRRYANYENGAKMATSAEVEKVVNDLMGK